MQVLKVGSSMLEERYNNYDYERSPESSEQEGEEDTEEASENEYEEEVSGGQRQRGYGAGGRAGVGGGGGIHGREYTEIKEQMYRDKLSHLKKQLQQLTDGTLPEWVKKLKRLEMATRERRRVNAIVKDLEMEMIDQDYLNEKKLAVREFEEHKVYLREHLIAELEEKQKMIENERHNMELTGDSMELKPISTRKLRRRINDPGASYGSGGVGDQKRKKPNQFAQMTYTLEDNEIIDDLKIINKNKAFSLNKPGTPNSSSSGGGGSSSPSFVRDIRVEDGKLFYEKRWFRRGQSILVEQKGGDKFPAMISAIGCEAIWVRKSSDNSKIRIYISQLTKGKFILKRRAV